MERNDGNDCQRGFSLFSFRAATVGDWNVFVVATDFVSDLDDWCRGRTLFGDSGPCTCGPFLRSLLWGTNGNSYPTASRGHTPVCMCETIPVEGRLLLLHDMSFIYTNSTASTTTETGLAVSTDHCSHSSAHFMGSIKIATSMGNNERRSRQHQTCCCNFKRPIFICALRSNCTMYSSCIQQLLFSATP